MTNHPNRGSKPRMAANPGAESIKAAREAAGLTQAQAAELVYSTLRTWQNWESASPQARRMHPAIWELWLIKTAHLRKAVSPEGLRYASKALQDRMQNEAEFADPEVMATFKREHRGMTPLQWAFAHFPELAREVAKEFPWMVPPEPPSEP